MRICVISPGVVHAVPRTVSIARQFDEVHFIDTAGKGSGAALADAGVICHTANASAGSAINNSQLLSLLRKIKPDAIVVHYASGDHYFSAITYGGCPVAAIVMGNDVLYDEGDSYVPLLSRLLVRMALRCSCFVSAKSQTLAKRVREFGIRAPVHVNYWGADLDRFSQGDKTEARRKLGLDECGTVILSSRALEPRLNIHLIVEAFRAVKDRYENASLVIIGRSSEDYRLKIDETIRVLGLSNCVIRRGDVDQDTLVEYYRAADAVVSMADCEGFPNTLLEVMACRVPFVVGRIAQVEELLVDNGNARICDINSHEIASALLDLLGDPEKRKRLTEAAYKTVSEYADIRKNGVIFSDLLKQHCNGSSPESSMRGTLFRSCYRLYRVQRRIWKG